MKNKLTLILVMIAVVVFPITVCANKPVVEKQYTDDTVIETTYKHNKVISDKEYTVDGKVVYEAEYGKDESVSKQTFYSDDGQQETVVYNRDKVGYVTSEIHYDSNGTETFRIDTEYNTNYTVNKYITYENSEIISEIYIDYNSEWLPTLASEYDKDNNLVRYTVYEYTETDSFLSETAYKSDGTIEYKYEFNEETMITVYSEYDNNGVLESVTYLDEYGEEIAVG